MLQNCKCYRSSLKLLTLFSFQAHGDTPCLISLKCHLAMDRGCSMRFKWRWSETIPGRSTEESVCESISVFLHWWPWGHVLVWQCGKIMETLSFWISEYNSGHNFGGLYRVDGVNKKQTLCDKPLRFGTSLLVQYTSEQLDQ